MANGPVWEIDGPGSNWVRFAIGEKTVSPDLTLQMPIFLGGLTFLLVPLSQPYSGTTAVLVDELHAASFESTADR